MLIMSITRSQVRIITRKARISRSAMSRRIACTRLAIAHTPLIRFVFYSLLPCSIMQVVPISYAFIHDQKAYSTTR